MPAADRKSESKQPLGPKTKQPRYYLEYEEHQGWTSHDEQQPKKKKT